MSINFDDLKIQQKEIQMKNEALDTEMISLQEQAKNNEE